MTNSENLKEIAAILDEAVAAGQLPYLREMLYLTAIITAVVMAIFFLLRAIGLYTINRRIGTKGALLAFVPGFSGYALGSAADALKKKKPSNYAVHMLMVELFYTLSSAVYYAYFVGRITWFFDALEAGHPMDTLSLLELIQSTEGADTPFLISYYAVYFLSYAVSFVSLLCFVRILQLFRSRGGFFLLIASVMVPQVMSVYLFAMRHKEIFRKPPVFRFPGMEEDLTSESETEDRSELEPDEDDFDEPSDGDGNGDSDRDGGDGAECEDTGDTASDEALADEAENADDSEENG